MVHPIFRWEETKAPGKKVPAQGHPRMKCPEPEDDCLLPEGSYIGFPLGM